MTFYGESVGLADVASLAGAVTDGPLYNGVETRDDGLSVTVSAGDSFILMVYGTTYLTDADVVGGLKWVLRASGSGTLDLADAHDPDWWTGATFTSLPSLTISDGTLTDYAFDATTSLRDAPLLDGNAGGEAIQLRVTVTSGSITLDKIRLQIEPVGGIAGHWSDWFQAGAYPIDSQNVELGESDQDTWGLTAYQNPVGVGATGALADVAWRNTNNSNPPPNDTPAWDLFRERLGHIYYPPTGWEAFRDLFPAALGLLIDNVDYSQRPDRTNYDNDPYVQYESTDPNTIAGWDMPDLGIKWLNDGSTFGGFRTATPSPDSQLQVELHTGLTVPAIGAGNAIFPGEGSGTILAIVTADTYYNSSTGVPDMIVPVADPGPVPTVGIFVSEPKYDTHPYVAGLGYEVSGSAEPYGALLNPRVRIIYPRYRYWIPGIPVPDLSGKLLDDRVRFTDYRLG